MRACFLRLLAMAGGLLLASAAQAAPEVQPRLKTGNWRIAVSMEVPNATGPSTGPSQHDRCLNASDTRNLLMIPPGAACTIRESKLTADQLTWTVSCVQGPYTSVATGRIDFMDTKFEGRILTVAQGTDIRITTRLAGRYLGACVPIRPQAPPATSPAPSAAPRAEGGTSTSPRLPRYNEN